MGAENIIISACITIFSLGLLLISLTSFYKYKNLKLLFVSLVFLIFFIKGLILSANVFIPGFLEINLYFMIFDLIILILLFIATLKR